MPAIWEMVKEAALSIGREATYSEIKQHVRSVYGEINESSLTCSIISSSVNHPSRIHYQENKRPRVCLGDHDFLFNTGRGRVAPYNPSIHGTWEIYIKEEGLYGVRVVEGNEDSEIQLVSDASVESSLFALESHLRDYLAKNLPKLNVFDSKLSIYLSHDGRDGVEFQTDVGPIDILALDDFGNFVVLELKLGRGPDATLGQILRYMGWVKKHLANGKDVRGIIVASEIPTKLRYAVSQVPSVRVMEYELSFSVRPVALC
ncbi:endonuclease NucS domain-containing protein [Alishewanella jeotgali]|jgi:hypothetical protein|uniref:RecB family-like nuclease n=1 Tax=Alishewanella jeotgali KCTC 22429 TaxID=1129374 RepID=H3ZDS6_9ALTE|nr:endonuclease NucS domain-containing protein [Alishewanella jeotgali]EHR41307.1 RecB family-like nuclease [Alishewanella jeotgali KCTC 22429]